MRREAVILKVSLPGEGRVKSVRVLPCRGPPGLRSVLCGVIARKLDRLKAR